MTFNKILKLAARFQSKIASFEDEEDFPESKREKLQKIIHYNIMNSPTSKATFGNYIVDNTIGEMYSEETKANPESIVCMITLSALPLVGFEKKSPSLNDEEFFEMMGGFLKHIKSSYPNVKFTRIEDASDKQGILKDIWFIIPQ